MSDLQMGNERLNDDSKERTRVSVLDRRELLRRGSMGMGVLGLAALLESESNGQASVEGEMRAASALAPKAPHFAPSAKHVVHLFMNGGPSHVDTFDPKPELTRLHGQPLPESHLRTERKTGAVMGSPFKFAKYGQSGIEVSEMFAQTAQHIDSMAIIRSMQSEVPNHEPSLMLMNCGHTRLPRPSMGSWITYGLGSENQNLPGFIAMCPGGYPIVSTNNWRSSFLPGAYQGTYIDTHHSEVEKLIANIRPEHWTLEEQRRQLDLTAQFNRRHSHLRMNDPALEARIAAFELAYGMQTEARDAFDLSQETQATIDAYTSTQHGRQLLITRRLIERGVRFVQVWSGAGQPWDNHDSLLSNHKSLGESWDRPIAAFLSDLKQRGLFDSTLVLWGGEFGRTPVAELPSLSGRDHNHYGFTCWLAGGGVKGGTVVGATDDFGFQAVERPVHVNDLHATILHLLGLDHEKLTFRYAGRDFRLTDVAGHVVREVIA